MQRLLLLPAPLFLLAASVLAHPDHGADFRHRVEAGPMVGWPVSGDIEEHNPAYGFQIDYHWNKALSTELSFTAFDDEMDTGILARRDLPTSAATELEIRDLALSGKLNLFGGPQWNIYAGGGVNYMDWQPDSRRVDDRIDQLAGDVIDLDVNIDTDWGYHGLVGFDIGVTDHLEFFAEYRHNVVESQINLNVVTERQRNRPVENKIKDDFDFEYGIVRLGLNFRW